LVQEEVLKECKIKIITGASMGIGKYLLEKYLSLGEDVRGTFFSNPPEFFKGYYTFVDVTKYDEVSYWIDSILPLGKIELINCAAINYNSFAHKSIPSQWEMVIYVNLIGTFNVIRAVLPYMRKNNYGRIINFSSIVDRLGLTGTSAYAASKAGLAGLVRVLATENASMGITVNNLNLGYFDIGMGRNILPPFRDEIERRIPTHKFGESENIYKAVNFIIDNSYINGASLDVNGGLV
jgi:acetoacetyl-CoA reductase/3-oxoacyl-[acyl-carrier protein] reductase